MTKFDIKKAPKGWRFPVTKKEVRSLIVETGARFDSVLFQGTRSSRGFLGSTWCWFGILQSERIEGEWHFRLEVNCLKEEYVIPFWREVVADVGAEVRRWVEKKRSLPPADPGRPTKLYLKYELGENGCVSCPRRPLRTISQWSRP